MKSKRPKIIDDILNSITPEKQLHDTFHEEYIQDEKDGDENLRRLVFKAKGFHTPPHEELSDREKQIILSTIQWLGSSVGQGFLDRCGFTRKK